MPTRWTYPVFGALKTMKPSRKPDETPVLFDDERVVAELVEEHRMGEGRHRSAPPTVDDLDDLVEVAFGDLARLHRAAEFRSLPAERKPPEATPVW